MRLLYHANHVAQHRLLAHGLGFHAENALFDNRSCQHLAAGVFFYRDGFACHHALVDRYDAIATNQTVDGNFLTGANFQDVAGLDSGDGDVVDGISVNEMGGLRLQAHQRADAAGSPLLGTLLQQTASEHEGEQ